MAKHTRVTLEIGPKGKRVVAVAPDWPGLERGPTTSSMIEYPDDMPKQLPGEFNRFGFRAEEHRLTADYDMDDFQSFGDWPNITVALAAAGYSEDELRKLLGLNYLRVLAEVVG